MEDIYSEILKSLRKGGKAALATIISRTGSAPRAVGAKYLIHGDGSSVGSIGGGCVEAEVWQRAQGVMERGEGDVLRFKLTAEQLAEGGLICGGNIDIFIEPLKEAFLEIYREIQKMKRKGGAGVLATLVSVDGKFPKAVGSKALIKPSGGMSGSLVEGQGLEERILGEVEKTLKEKRPVLLVLQAEKEESPWKSIEVLLEPVFSEPTVYVFGAGHVSEQIVPLAKRVQFKVVVIDDREMFANRERFPDADEIIVTEFERSFDRLEIDDSSFIVIVTRGHLYDGFVLGQAVKTRACYIGMIGSKKKIRILYHELMKQGVSKETLEQVHAPIGLDINSETPEEIAVSIVAQLIKVRGESGPLS
ncbi:MAG: XdhC/CoxI family protein [Deltaproteobacteria bacterium]|nr:MAG: XdhC/CoxI family protein [Deltaproteobacteria bacterium]